MLAERLGRNIELTVDVGGEQVIVLASGREGVDEGAPGIDDRRRPATCTSSPRATATTRGGCGRGLGRTTHWRQRTVSVMTVATDDAPTATTGARRRA